METYKCEMCEKDKEVGRHGVAGEFICNECIADDSEKASGLLYFYQQCQAQASSEISDDDKEYWREIAEELEWEEY